MNAITTTDRPASVVMRYEDVERLADSIAKSRLFGITTKDQAIVLMMISHAEGRHPALAARDYDIIQNRPSKKAEAMLRDFLEAGGSVQWHALTDAVADATFSHPKGGTVRITWDMPRAEQAGLKKDMYKKFPRQMLRSRTVSEGVRTVWPLATSGFHVPEEVAEFTGTTLDAEPQPPPSGNDPRGEPPRAAAAAMPRPERVYAPEEPDPDPERPGISRDDQTKLDAWLVLFGAAQTTDAVRKLETGMRYQAAMQHAPAAIADALRAMCARAYIRVQPKAEPTATAPVENAPENAPEMAGAGAGADEGDGRPS